MRLSFAPSLRPAMVPCDAKIESWDAGGWPPPVFLRKVQRIRLS